MEQNKFQNYRNKINEIIKTQKGKDDKNILEVLYGLANLEDVHSNEEKQKLNRTDFSKISDDALYLQFQKEYFNKMPKAKKLDLFQEVYNRHTKLNDTETRYVCSMIPDYSGQILAYINTDENTLALNSVEIEKGINRNPSNWGICNSNNVGLVYLTTVLHEIEHNVQIDSALKFVLDEEKDKDKKAMGAIILMYLATSSALNQKHKTSELKDLENNYIYAWEEQDANHYGIKTVFDAYKRGDIKDKNILETLTSYTLDSIRVGRGDIRNGNYKKELKARTNRVESGVNMIFNYFDKYVEDCELKEKISNTVIDYMKSKNNQPSDFRKKCEKDLQELANIAKVCMQENEENLINSK